MIYRNVVGTKVMQFYDGYQDVFITFEMSVFLSNLFAPSINFIRFWTSTEECSIITNHFEQQIK